MLMMLDFKSLYNFKTVGFSVSGTEILGPFLLTPASFIASFVASAFPQIFLLLVTSSGSLLNSSEEERGGGGGEIPGLLPRYNTKMKLSP